MIAEWGYEASDFEGPTREEAKVREYYTLVDRDVGKNWLLAFEQTWLVSDFMGRILPTDVGKRVYQQGDVLQIESNNQRSRRFGIWPWCECMDTLCRATIADTGHHPASGRPPAVGCGQPAVMRLFQVTMLQVTIMVHRTLLVEGKPIAFCEPCGDNALQSGAFATSEDTAAALRAEEVHYITHGYPPEEGQ
jgi:hypothetical protein